MGKSLIWIRTAPSGAVWSDPVPAGLIWSVIVNCAGQETMEATRPNHSANGIPWRR